jgi:hypothetical protein
MVLDVGDLMPRIVLPQLSGGLFDSYDPRSAGQARAYWLGTPPDAILTPGYTEVLAGCEMLLHVVTKAPPPQREGMSVSWIIDAKGELARAFGDREPLALIVDATGRLAAILAEPTAEAVAAVAAQLHDATSSVVVRSQAPVLLLERVADASLCQALIDYWQGREKLTNTIDAPGGNIASADLKRRQDVQVADGALIARLRVVLMGRIAHLIQQVFHTKITVFEAPVVGGYDETSGGWFRRHRDNTTPMTANRQFAVSLNLNGSDEYEGGEVRFPEFGRALYRPTAGGALVFSCSLLHEVVPITRGRRIGLFSFLSERGRDPRLNQPRPGRS